jgi:hypothetical protein
VRGKDRRSVLNTRPIKCVKDALMDDSRIFAIDAAYAMFPLPLPLPLSSIETARARDREIMRASPGSAGV